MQFRSSTITGAVSRMRIDVDGRSAQSFAIHAVPDYFPASMNSSSAKLKIGSQVRVTQQIAARDHTYTSDVRGTVVDYSQKQTGSWYAHGKDDKLWLDRLTLKKLDGELITLNLDDYSVVEVDA